MSNCSLMLRTIALWQTAALVAIIAASPNVVAAQGASNSGAASHEIRIVATVPPTCQLGQLRGATRAVLSGRTDGGDAVHIEFNPSTGFNVECNTPYALSLQRIGMPVPVPPRSRASSSGARVAGALQRALGEPESSNVAAPDGFDVLVQIADRKISPGSAVALEQRCMFGVREALDEHCAIQADGLPLLPLRRNVARLTLIPRSTASDIANDADGFDETVPAMGDDQPIGTAKAVSLVTGAVPAADTVKRPVIHEHLMLSVTGSF